MFFLKNGLKLFGDNGSIENAMNLRQNMIYIKLLTVYVHYESQLFLN